MLAGSPPAQLGACAQPQRTQSRRASSEQANPACTRDDMRQHQVDAAGFLVMSSCQKRGIANCRILIVIMANIYLTQVCERSARYFLRKRSSRTTSAPLSGLWSAGVAGSASAGSGLAAPRSADSGLAGTGIAGSAGEARPRCSAAGRLAL